MNSHFKNIISYSELHGQKLSMDAVRSTVKDFKLSNIVEMIARLNFRLFREEYNMGLQKRLACQLLDAGTREEALRRLVMEPNRIIFSRMQLLKLLQLACCICKENGSKTFESEKHSFEFGRSTLITNDLLITEDTRVSHKRGHEHMDVLGPLVNIAELSSFEGGVSITYSMARWHIMLFEIAPKVSQACNNIDIGSLVKTIYGMPLEKYYALIFAILTHLDKLEIKDLMANPSLLFIDTTSFLNVPGILDLSKQYSKLVGLDIIDLSKIGHKIQEMNRSYPEHSFMTFRQYPLVRFSKDRLLCVDRGFLGDKLSSGIYWGIHKFLREKCKGRVKNLMDFLGEKLFEKYVDDLFRRTYPKSHSVITPTHYLSPPDFEDSDYGDGIVYSEDSKNIAFLEYKSSFLKVGAKYRGTSDPLESDIRKKFVEVGVAQLARKIGNFASANALHKNPIPCVNYANVENIFPILVAMEPAIYTFFMNDYLDREFQKKIKDYQIDERFRVQPLVALTINDLERLEPYLSSRGLWRCLQQYISSKYYRCGSFRTYISDELYKHEFLPNPFLKQKFDEIGTKIMATLSEPPEATT